MLGKINGNNTKSNMWLKSIFNLSTQKSQFYDVELTQNFNINLKFSTYTYESIK